MTTLQSILAIIAAVVLTAVVTFLLTSRKMRGKVAYMLDALEDKELNFRFDERRLAGRKFNRTLNRLRNIFDKERHEIIEQEKYFGLMLDHVSSASDRRIRDCLGAVISRFSSSAQPAKPLMSAQPSSVGFLCCSKSSLAFARYLSSPVQR